MLNLNVNVDPISLSIPWSNSENIGFARDHLECKVHLNITYCLKELSLFIFVAYDEKMLTILIKEVDFSNLLFIWLFSLIKEIFPPDSCNICAKRIGELFPNKSYNPIFYI